MTTPWNLPARLLGGTLVLLVRVYHWTLSPIFGRQCRFEPTCSNYFIGAVRKYGPFAGSWRGIRRLARCHPLYRGPWYDPP
ncbi:MAG: membrane protein insertion efficiency factor YidD [Pirellulales bacterium]